jgi:hypothetical protein
VITRPDAVSGRELYTVHCDTDGCTAALSAKDLRGVARIERDLLRHDGAGRHYCPACVVRRGPGIAERPCPHPGHR